MQSRPRRREERITRMQTGRQLFRCVCVCVRDTVRRCMHWQFESVCRSNQSFQSLIICEYQQCGMQTHKLKLLNWTDRKKRQRHQNWTLEGVREQETAWERMEDGRMEGRKSKKRDSYYRAGCRGRLFSPSSLWCQKTIGGLGESQS